MRSFSTFILLVSIPTSAISDDAFTNAVEGQPYIPAVLVNFSAFIQNDTVSIQWSSLGEAGDEYFEVQRSANARTWEIIAYVKGKGSESENSYQQADITPVHGQSFYRLRQVNANGTSRYSKTVAVYYSEAYRSCRVSPGSTGSNFVIKNRSLTHREMELYNESGHRVIFKSSTKEDDTQIDLQRMPKGVYTLRINRGIAIPSIIKLVKQ
ncbi:MAG: T9SS type A sorting domain-containing protein [Agriterribacter sp.]